jgi:hypothetical protein
VALQSSCQVQGRESWQQVGQAALVQQHLYNKPANAGTLHDLAFPSWHDSKNKKHRQVAFLNCSRCPGIFSMSNLV